ncbi:MAG: hypothetical protein KJO31_14460 [Gammaproteobacteria bacterium]|nr:hypothetical protein [Gammaproteobacteria bacterium]
MNVRPILVATTILATGAAAAAVSADTMQACAAETDDTARLACYDRAAAEAANAGAEAARAAETAAAAQAAEADAAAMAAGKEAAAKAAEAEAMAMAAETEAAASAAEAEAVAMAAANEGGADSEAARAAAEDEFGMNRDLESKRPDKQKERENELRELRAEVVEVRHRPGGEHIVTLENGQVWVEKTAVFGFRVKVGDTVTLKKGVFGGYKMVTRSRRSSQVRRVD